MNKFTLLFIFVIATISVTLSPVFADETRPDHFEGLAANTLEEALVNFKTYNKKLENILAKDELSPEDLGNIHIMSYTIENALQKMMQESEKIAQALESVHLGSETMDYERVKLLGEFYLKNSALLYGKE